MDNIAIPPVECSTAATPLVPSASLRRRHIARSRLQPSGLVGLPPVGACGPCKWVVWGLSAQWQAKLSLLIAAPRPTAKPPFVAFFWGTMEDVVIVRPAWLMHCNFQLTLSTLRRFCACQTGGHRLVWRWCGMP